MKTLLRFTHRGVRVEVWQGNDNEQKLGYTPWFWRPVNERGERLRINWAALPPSGDMTVAKSKAIATINRILDWYPVR